MKQKWICEECSIKFKKFTEEVNHLLDKVVCDKCYKQQATSTKLDKHQAIGYNRINYKPMKGYK